MITVVLKVLSNYSNVSGTVLLAIGGNNLVNLWGGVVFECCLEVLIGELMVVEFSSN